MNNHADLHALEQRLQAAYDQISFLEQRYANLVHAAGDIVYEYIIGTGEIIWSDSITAILGYTLQEAAGGVDQWVELIHPADEAETFRLLEEAQAQGSAYNVEYRFRHKAGQYQWIHDRGFFIVDATGTATHMIGVMEDITARKHAEEEQLQIKEQIILLQQQALQELSTPLIPISDRIVVLPLIGPIDTQRAQQILEALLNGITSHQADTAVIDITGVPLVDTQVADALLQAAQAVRLLGAKVVLTGIQPEVAQTLISLNIDTSALITYASLQTAMQHLLRRSKADV